MAQERIYERQIRPGATPTGPMADAGDFGAGVGQSVAQMGNVIHQTQVRAYQLERQAQQDSQAADFHARFTRLRADLDDASREARANAKPGAEGHSKAMRTLLEEQGRTLLDGVTEDSVRRTAQQQLDEYALRFLKSEEDYQEGQRVAKLTGDMQSATEIAANRARRMVDPAAFGEEFKLGLAAIDALPGVPPDVKQKLKDYHSEQVSAAFLSGVVDSNPGTARAMADSGQFDFLPPAVLERVRTGADVELRRIEAAAEHAAAVRKVEIKEQIGVLKEKASQGIDVSDALPEAIASARAIGDESLAVQLEGLWSDSQFAKVYNGKTPIPPAQRELRMRQLAALDKPNQQQQRELKWLREKGGGLDAQWNNDPFGSAAATTPPPALDFGNAATVEARKQWAAAQSKALGRPVPPISRNEAAALGEQKRSGMAGYSAVMDQLATLGGRAGTEAARAVDGNDLAFHRMVALPRPYRVLAMQGRDALKGNAALIKAADEEGQALFARQDAELKRALGGVVPGQQSAIIEMGNHILAGLVAQGSAPTPGNRWKALNMALGARGHDGGQVGGVARWGDQMVLLPDNLTAEAFNNKIRSITARAVAAGQGPVNPDGSAATIRRSVPVSMPDGSYQFRTPGGRYFERKDGEVFRIPAEMLK